MNAQIKNIIDTFWNVDNDAFERQITEEYTAIGDSEVYGCKYACSDAEHRASDYIYQKLQEIGVGNVEKVPVRSAGYQFNDATLTVCSGALAGTVMKPGPYPAPGTGAEGIEAELVNVGGGSLDEMEAAEIRGKIILADTAHGVAGLDHIPTVINADHMGAAGVIIYQTEDMYDEDTVRTQPLSETPTIPVVGMSLRDVQKLLDQMQQGPVTVNLQVDATCYTEGSTSYCVVGEIPGELPEERILISGHIDHFFRCMQDDISAVVTNLSIAKAMVDMGYRPKRTICFLFVSSHETGTFSSITPYIHGSWKLIAEAKKDWAGKVVAAINFEYMAMRLKGLRTVGSYEMQPIYKAFLDYVPDAVPGFDEVISEMGVDEYYMLSWSDAVSYVCSGIPVAMNDPVYEQYFTEEGSVYTGRDHSTADNADIYDYDVLGTNRRWYGSLAIFIDQMDVPAYDFSVRARMLQPLEEEAAVLQAASLDAAQMQSALTGIEEGGKTLYAKLTDLPADAQLHRELTGELLEIQNLLVQTTDKINGHLFVQMPYKKHCETIGALDAAIAQLENGEGEKALQETLAAIDMGYVAARHGRVPSQRLAEIDAIPSHKDWRENRESGTLFLTDPIVRLRELCREGSDDYSEVIAMLQEEKGVQTEAMKKSWQEELQGLQAVKEKLDACVKKLER